MRGLATKAEARQICDLGKLFLIYDFSDADWKGRMQPVEARAFRPANQGNLQSGL